MGKISKEARERIVKKKNKTPKTFCKALKILLRIALILFLISVIGYSAFKYGLIPATSIKEDLFDVAKKTNNQEVQNVYIPNYEFDYKYWALDYATSTNKDIKQTSVSGISIDSRESNADNTTYFIPLNGEISSNFGIRLHPIRKTQEMHNGIDIKGNHGDPYYAFADGRVYDTGFETTLGNYIRIEHQNNLTSHYFHSSKVLVKIGQKVSSGEKIGLVGSTGYALGPHLHFEVHEKNTPVDPLNFINLIN